jgi:hypothetical protein
MAKKQKADFNVNIDNVISRVDAYPLIKTYIKPHLAKLIESRTNPPLIEQVHEVIEWLHRYTKTSVELLEELELIIDNISKYKFINWENLLTSYFSSQDKNNYNSSYSEIFLANYFIRNKIRLLEYEPFTNKLDKKADFKIMFENDEYIVELITPSYEAGDFNEPAKFLFERLERIRTGLYIEVSKFESYLSADLHRTKVESPTIDNIETIISNFRKYVYKESPIKDFPKVLPVLCEECPNINITITSDNYDKNKTHVALSESRTGSWFPLNRFIKLILDERHHLNPLSNNLILLDLSRWRMAWLSLDSPYFRKSIFDKLARIKSSRIDVVLSYILSNQKNQELIEKIILYLNPDFTIKHKKKLLDFLIAWENCTILDSSENSESEVLI